MSIRLYQHNDLAAAEIIDEMCSQARLALENGFDGVMTSEHHGGFAGYLSQPLQMASFILEMTDLGWAAPAPLLLPIRATTLVAEEVAWLSARFRGRVGLGVAAGALPRDFHIAGVDPADAVKSFKAELPKIVAMLRGEGLGEVVDDPALLACRADPVPVLSAAMSVAAASRAAQCGAGILLEGMSDPARIAQLCRAFDEADGRGSKVLIRRVWLGDPKDELIGRQRQIYDGFSRSSELFGSDQTLVAAEPRELAERALEAVAMTGVDALNLRVHLPGMSPGEVRDQIEVLGSGVVPMIQASWPG